MPFTPDPTQTRLLRALQKLELGRCHCATADGKQAELTIGFGTGVPQIVLQAWVGLTGDPFNVIMELLVRRELLKPLSATPIVRCAIYCRKSSEEGLKQEFNSIDAQRAACEADITSQKSEGLVCLPDHFDDGGYTGGNMERPALQRLLADIAAGKIDCVIVYTVDRLSRSLTDFAKIVDVFELPRRSDPGRDRDPTA